MVHCIGIEIIVIGDGLDEAAASQKQCLVERMTFAGIGLRYEHANDVAILKNDLGSAVRRSAVDDDQLVLFAEKFTDILQYPIQILAAVSSRNNVAYPHRGVVDLALQLPRNDLVFRAAIQKTSHQLNTVRRVPQSLLLVTVRIFEAQRLKFLAQSRFSASSPMSAYCAGAWLVSPNHRLSM